MTDAFTASNGIQITMDPDRDGKVYLVGRRARGDEGQYLDTHATGGPEGIVALREFFQHERDEELGRWRWPENPDYVVYPDANDPRLVTVMRESAARIRKMRRGRDNALSNDYNERFGECADTYFEAHPERKPWEDATPGEVWLFRAKGDVTPSAFMKSYVGWTNSEAVVVQRDPVLPHGGSRDESFEPRRIWPEDAS